MSLLGPYPVGEPFSNMSWFRQSQVADGTYFLTIVFISSWIRPKQPFTMSNVELKEINLFCFLSNSPAETLYLVSCYKLCSLSNFPRVCISLQCDDTKQQCPKPSLSAHTFCKVKVKRISLQWTDQTDAIDTAPVLQEESQRIGTACSGFLGPELRRRRQPIRSLLHHLLPDWEQPSDQLLLNTSRTALNTAEKKTRTKGSDFFKRKTGSQARRQCGAHPW